MIDSDVQVMASGYIDSTKSFALTYEAFMRICGIKHTSMQPSESQRKILPIARFYAALARSNRGAEIYRLRSASLRNRSQHNFRTVFRTVSFYEAEACSSPAPRSRKEMQKNIISVTNHEKCIKNLIAYVTRVRD